MSNRDVLAIGASAGGVEALLHLAARLPRDLPAAVLVTLHLGRSSSVFDEIMARAGPLPASFAKEGERVAPGRIYIAPPDRHLLLIGGVARLGAGARENFARPAIDAMMRSVAVCCGPRATGAILTGELGDGAAGLSAIQRCGGVTVVQDPGDAAFSGMPTRALQMVRPDHVAPLRELPVLLDALARQPEGAPVEPPPGLRLEVDMALGRSAGTEELGERSVQTCPICHGSMWNVEDGELIRFRCHVGHAFSAEAMQSSLSDSLRDALSIALRSVQERAHLLANMERRSRQHGHERLATQWAERLQECRREMEVVRSAMERVYRAEKNLPAEEFQGEPNPS